MLNKFLPILVLFASNSFAKEGGTGAGNGGDVLICSNPHTQTSTIEFFDLYEMRLIHQRTPDLGPSSLSPIEKLEKIAARNEGIFPDLMKEMLDHARKFESRSAFVTEELKDVPDTGDMILPSGCRLGQLVIRTLDPSTKEPRFKINSNYWNRLDSDNRAATILHEFFYGRGVDLFRHQNSMGSRYLNGLFLSHPGASARFPGPLADLFFWIERFKRSNHGFDEPWGDWVPEGKGNREIKVEKHYPGPKDSLRGRCRSPFRVMTENMGEIVLGEGDYRLAYLSEIPTLVEGNLVSEWSFQHPWVRVRGAGRTIINDENYGYEDAKGSYLAHDFERARFESITLPDLEVTLAPECITPLRVWTKKRSEDPGYEFRLMFTCEAEFSNSKAGWKLKTSRDTTTTLIAGGGKNGIRDMSGGTVQWEWAYGHAEFNPKSFTVLQKGDDQLEIAAVGMDSRPTLGHFPRLYFGDALLEKIPFSEVTLTSILDQAVSRLRTSDEPYDIRLNEKFKVRAKSAFLRFASSTGKAPAYPAEIFPLSVDKIFEIVELDTFGSDFLRPLSWLYTESKNVFQVTADEPLWPKDHSPTWISGAELRWWRFDWKPIGLLSLFGKEAIRGFKLDFSTTEILKPECRRGVIERYKTRDSHRYRINFTPEGARKFGSRTFETETRDKPPSPKPNLGYEICLTREGYKLNDLRKEKP